MLLAFPPRHMHIMPLFCLAVNDVCGDVVVHYIIWRHVFVSSFTTSLD